MSGTVDRSDLGIGLGLFFVVLAIVGATGMALLAANQLLAGASFAVAVTAGSLAVVAIHLYE